MRLSLPSISILSVLFPPPFSTVHPLVHPPCFSLLLTVPSSFFSSLLPPVVLPPSPKVCWVLLGGPHIVLRYSRHNALPSVRERRPHMVSIDTSCVNETRAI